MQSLSLAPAWNSEKRSIEFNILVSIHSQTEVVSNASSTFKKETIRT